MPSCPARAASALAACPAFVCSLPRSGAGCLWGVCCPLGGGLPLHAGSLCAARCAFARVLVWGLRVCHRASRPWGLGLAAPTPPLVPRAPLPSGTSVCLPLGPSLGSGGALPRVVCSVGSQRGKRGERASFPCDLGGLGAGPRQMAFPLLVRRPKKPHTPLHCVSGRPRSPGGQEAAISGQGGGDVVEEGQHLSSPVPPQPQICLHGCE